MRKIKKITVRMNNGDVLEYEGADKGTKIEEGNMKHGELIQLFMGAE